MSFKLGGTILEDLVVYPVAEPDPLQTPPFFRLAVIDVIVASRTIATMLWDEVSERVCILVDALDKKDRLKVEESLRCGDPVTTPEISESSMSESVSLSQSQSQSASMSQ